MLGQEAEEDVRFRFPAVRVVLQPLVSSVVAFDADPAPSFLFPCSDDSKTMARRQRRVQSFTEFKLARVNVCRAGGGRERASSSRAQKFETTIEGRPRQIDELISVVALHINRIAHARIKQSDRKGRRT